MGKQSCPYPCPHPHPCTEPHPCSQSCPSPPTSSSPSPSLPLFLSHLIPSPSLSYPIPIPLPSHPHPHPHPCPHPLLIIAFNPRPQSPGGVGGGLVETQTCPFLAPSQHQRVPTGRVGTPTSRGQAWIPGGGHEMVAVSLVTHPFMRYGSNGCEVAPSRPPPSHGAAPLGMENIDGRQAGELPREAAPPEQKVFMVAPGDFPGCSSSRAGAGKAWPRGGHSSGHRGWARLGRAPRELGAAQSQQKGQEVQEGMGPQPQSPSAGSTSRVCIHQGVTRNMGTQVPHKGQGCPLLPGERGITPGQVG